MKKRKKILWIAFFIACFFLQMPLAGATGTDRKMDTQAERLVLKKVALFNTGVGYFQLRGTMPAGKSCNLYVKRDQMNDLLKSLTVINLSGGQVNSIDYDNSKTAGQKLDEFNFHLQKEQGLPQILRQLQGSEVAVLTGNTSVPGTIMGVEKRNTQTEKRIVPRFFLTIMDRNNQMRTFDTGEITGIKLVDAKLNKDLNRYLSILFQKHQKNGKTITITSAGEGPQDLLVSYITEVPVWKATYRIVLPDSNKGNSPFLQGWAIVDNVSGEDWQNVQLSLVSGLPVSFVQELYAPRFKKRPELKMDDEDTVTPAVPEAAMGENRMLMAAPASPKARPGTIREKGMARRYSKEPDMEQSIRELKARTVTREVGDMFEYRIDHPVTIGQNRSALVPIVSKEIEGQAVDLYNERTRKQHPLAGIKLKNTTGLTLEGGPLTVLKGGTYGGEAFVKSLKPNEQRYITYAVDLGLHVNTKKGSTTEPVDRVVINRGLMRLHRGIIETRTYTLNNKNAQSKTVVLEHPFHSNWKLLHPKEPLEITDNYLRFEVEVPGLTQTTFMVKEIRDVWESISISNLTPDNILIFAREKYLDNKTLKQMEKMVAVKAELARIENDLKTIDGEKEQIFKDQNRLRANLKGLGQTSEEKGLRSRYIQQLGDQETRLGQIKQQEGSLKTQQKARKRALETLMGNLSQDLRI
ncbi:MAG: hypothetical protein GY846_21310 [Deltaproteobacteria bacterium]|nr:hypothetical protein [Deltaproteobacteria bacterium]